MWRFKPKRCVKEIYPEEVGMVFFFFLFRGPELKVFWCLEAGALLEPVSGAGAFWTREAGGSPTSASSGVTCSST
jgi:hypothetical protein